MLCLYMHKTLTIISLIPERSLQACSQLSQPFHRPPNLERLDSPLQSVSPVAMILPSRLSLEKMLVIIDPILPR